MDQALKFVSDHVGVAEVVLVILMLLGAWVIWQAQKRADFDFAKMLKDESGKESAIRLGILVSLAISTWVVMHDTLAATLTNAQFWAYLIIWSGAKVADTIAQRWNGTMPFSKPPGA